jgi:transcriptional regulator with GAF, ATPase, and Fis domain
MSVNESITLSGVDRSEVATITSAVTNNNPGYEYNVTKNRRGEITITRVVPENMYNRAQYISSINKTTLVRTLKQNNNVKTRTGEALGVSARTIGRLMQRHGI